MIATAKSFNIIKEGNILRNLKVGHKLLLGFGTVLLVFVISVFVTRRYIMVAEEGSISIVSGILPSLGLISDLDGAAYEIFLAARYVRYREDQASMDEYKARLAEYLGIESEIRALNRDQPQLSGPDYVSKCQALFSVVRKGEFS